MFASVTTRAKTVANPRFHIAFPELLERQLPRESGHVVPATKTSFGNNPPERLEAVVHRGELAICPRRNASTGVRMGLLRPRR